MGRKLVVVHYFPKGKMKTIKSVRVLFVLIAVQPMITSVSSLLSLYDHYILGSWRCLKTFGH